METFSALLALSEGNQRSPLNSPHKGQWRGALMIYLICAWTNGWANNRDAGGLGRHRAHHGAAVIIHGSNTPVLDPFVIEPDQQGFAIWYHTNISLQWRHNGHDGVTNHRRGDCLFNRLFRWRSKKKSKLRVTGLCASPAQMASDAENASIWWRHHDEVLTIRSLGNNAMWCSLDQSTRILPAGCCMKGWHQGANVSPMARNSVVGFTIPVINCTMKDEAGPHWLKRKCSNIVEIFVTELCILITVISHEHRQTDCLFNILFKEKNFKTHYYWFFVWESIGDEFP